MWGLIDGDLGGLLTKFNNAECISPTFCGKNTFLFQLFLLWRKLQLSLLYIMEQYAAGMHNKPPWNSSFGQNFQIWNWKTQHNGKMKTSLSLDILEQAVTNHLSSFGQQPPIRRSQNGLTKTKIQSFSMHLLTDFFESSVTAATLLLVTAYWCCRRGKAHALESLARDYLYFEIIIFKYKWISHLYLISFLVFFRVSMLVRSWSEMPYFHKGVTKLPLSADMWEKKQFLGN